MRPVDAVIELFDRFAAYQTEKVFITEAELSDWPIAAYSAMKKQRIISKAKAAKSAVCPGCEQECIMPVHVLPDDYRTPELFVLCDKRSDTNRVKIKATDLMQWYCNAEAICRFIADALGLRRTEQTSDLANHWYIGVATGNKRSQMLCLQVDDFCMLVAGGNALPLADFIRFDSELYTLDVGMLTKLVDTANTADDRYTPSTAKQEVRKQETQEMYRDWQKEYKKLKRANTNMKDTDIARKISRMVIASGRSADTIRKWMVK
ncbi:hypothetical protein KEF85_09990 [Methylomonas paludis]|uniref:Uncharacterized protein n=1 Tax=Methylomonas paludis TaxID=1173101 RepID=A0A975MKW8_9GAMM|nr:hypothetical protein [Methylomonas paludis]QWF69706.1 hypothetical protein KEF85_09990 [Methylomonas paludis]